MLFIISILLFGCNFQSNQKIEDNFLNNLEEYEQQKAWTDKHKFIAEKINYPDMLNCSTLAWIIENSVYPKEMCIKYNSTTLDSPNVSSWVNTGCDLNTKDDYDDYFFKECLTQNFE